MHFDMFQCITRLTYHETEVTRCPETAGGGQSSLTLGLSIPMPKAMVATTKLIVPLRHPSSTDDFSAAFNLALKATALTPQSRIALASGSHISTL
eukprot:m.289503 g.289503  ORF g.289503 m.289503 type:complete len:95 (-) comp16227_c3_seq1:1254-1538(-)